MINVSTIARFLAAGLFAAVLGGCGSNSNSAPQLNGSGKHPAAWYVDHRQAYSRAYLANGALECRDCHGSDLSGGISKVSCMVGMIGFPDGACHANGHPPRPVAHLLPYLAAPAHGPVAKADLIACQACHGTNGGSGSNPRFNGTIGFLTSGCEDCHKTGTAHPPVDPAKLSGYDRHWNSHATAGNQAAACALCHGIDFNGGSGPACRSCHLNLANGTLPSASSCLSCHGTPPLTGAHGAHSALPGLAVLCSACHGGAGSGTARHGYRGFNNVTTAFPAAYAARTGGPVRLNSNGTCAGVSCHGGVITPPWSGGSIAEGTQCAACHTAKSVADQANSFFSGQHTLHVSQKGIPCIDCHDMTVTSNNNSHFSNLATPIFELAPRLTIRVPVNYSGNSCTPGQLPPSGSFSVGTCHGTESW